LTSPFIWWDSWGFLPFFFFFLFFSFFSMLHVLRTLEFWWYLRRKSFLQKPLFKWHDVECHGHDYRYTDSRRIFRNGVMHASIAKPWLWRCGSCGYIGGGHIFWSGGYARQYFWVRLANNVGSKSFLNFFQNSIGHIP
jgi:hypothetical protein